ncbi:MAG: Sulphatase-modifying factor protein [Rhodopirellula sp.]|nr:Sulphatase-modifying factor protein [Rhodopirellula sp.]
MSVNQIDEGSVGRFKFVVVIVIVVFSYGCQRSNPTHLSTIDAARVGSPKPINSIGMEFKLIPAGTFAMGEGDDIHEVTLAEPFMMSIHEVTQVQYIRIMSENPSQFEGADHPVQKVDWYDAVEFCEKLSELPIEKAAGHVYRLPTDAEWEYACRAGSNTQFSFGDQASELENYGWYSANSGGMTHPVGVKQPNAWGLYDMHGNVWEWCQGSAGNSSGGGTGEPTVAESEFAPVGRGGGWYGTARDARSAVRSSINPAFNSGNLGFRVLLVPSKMQDEGKK